MWRVTTWLMGLVVLWGLMLGAAGLLDHRLYGHSQAGAPTATRPALVVGGAAALSSPAQTTLAPPELLFALGRFGLALPGPAPRRAAAAAPLGTASSMSSGPEVSVAFRPSSARLEGDHLAGGRLVERRLLLRLRR